MDKQKIRGYCIVSAFTVVLYLALSNMDRLTGALRVAGGLLAPFFVGVAIAFILNNVMVLFEKKVFYRLAEGRNPRSARMVRPLSLVSTYLVTFAAFGVLLWVVVPQLAASVVTLGNNIPAYLESLRVLGNRLQGELTLPAEALEQIAAWFSQAAGRAAQLPRRLCPADARVRRLVWRAASSPSSSGSSFPSTC